MNSVKVVSDINRILRRCCCRHDCQTVHSLHAPTQL